MNPGWKPHTIRIGRRLLAAVRAVTGEWAIEGRVRRLAFVQGKAGSHLIIGPWCLTLTKETE
jgi:hypothetical protein